VLAELLTIGDELCRGEIVDTNASWLAEQLWEQQVTVHWMSSCRDDRRDMAEILERAAARSDLVLVSGGLGPTLDDLTVDVVAAVAGVEPELDEASALRVRQRFEAAGLPMVDNVLRQARAPAGARIYRNPVGSAPAFEVAVGEAAVICLPGPPRELQAIFNDSVADRIRELAEARGERREYLARRIFRTFGRGESNIAAALEGLDVGERGSLHFQVKFPETLVKVLVRDTDAARADAELQRIDGQVRERLGTLLYGTDGDSMAAVVGRELLARQHTLVTAESCTGGLVGSMLTAVPGSSAYYLGGSVTYANSEKVRQLGVSQKTLDSVGAVSEECVLEMACGARERAGADWAVSLSGIAGPDGGSTDKPVGTVWVGLAGPDGRKVARRYHWPGERNRVRTLAAYWALNLLRRQLGEEAV
jgi:nicotinamide-nucleotide amidase